MPKLPVASRLSEEIDKLASHKSPVVPSLYIGIDPGASGGLVALFSSGEIEAVPMPDTEREVWNWFKPS